MNNGGYQIVDLKETNFALGTAKTVKGAYEKIEGTRKPILLSGIVVANVEYHDVFVAPKSVSSKFEFTVYGFKFSITSADAITVTSVS